MAGEADRLLADRLRFFMHRLQDRQDISPRKHATIGKDRRRALNIDQTALLRLRFDRVGGFGLFDAALNTFPVQARRRDFLPQ